LKRAIVTIAVAVAALALTSGAFASSLTSGHGSTPKSSATLGAKVTKKPAKHAVKHVAVKPAVKASTLPFTGIDLAAAAFGGSALIGVGFMLRRTSRQRS
jgi:hypothetical protein